MVLNLTTIDFSGKTAQQIFEICHHGTAVPSLIIVYVLSLFILGLCGISVNKDDKPTFWKIWLTFAALFIAVIIIFSIMPNVVMGITNFFSKLF